MRDYLSNKITPSNRHDFRYKKMQHPVQPIKTNRRTPPTTSFEQEVALLILLENYK